MIKMSEKPIRFHRLIPESVWDNEEGNIRKVAVFVSYGDWRMNIGAIMGFDIKAPIKELRKIYCMTNKTCENQVCKSLFLPNCPHSRHKRAIIDRRKKEYKTIANEIVLERWEEYGGWNYEFIDLMKKYQEIPFEEIPVDFRTKLKIYFLAIDPDTSAFDFFRRRFPDFFRIIIKERLEKERTKDKKKELKNRVIYKIGEYYYIYFNYIQHVYQYIYEFFIDKIRYGFGYDYATYKSLIDFVTEKKYPEELTKWQKQSPIHFKILEYLVKWENETYRKREYNGWVGTFASIEYFIKALETILESENVRKGLKYHIGKTFKPEVFMNEYNQMVEEIEYYKTPTKKSKIDQEPYKKYF